MRLLFVLPEYLPRSGGGIITFYRMFLPGLAAAGHEVKVLVGSGVSADYSASPTRIDGVDVEMLELDRLEAWAARFKRYAAVPGLRRHLAAAWALREQARNGDGYDLVETTDWGLLFVPWVLEDGPPALVQMHGSCGQIDLHDPVAGEELQGDVIRSIEAQALPRADWLQTYSRANAGGWSGRVGREVECLRPAWKPLAGEDRSAARSDRGLVVGRVQRWKGPQVLCEALSLMGDRAPAIDWIGRDTCFGERGASTSAHLAATYPEVWNRRLVHRPQLPPEEVARQQAAAAFAVVPSTWDMFNLTCVEAMAAGTPVVCSTGAGASELVADGVNGFVFETGDGAALAEALGRCLSLSPAEREAVGAAGRRTILDELAPGAIVARRLQRYRDVSASVHAAAPADDWLRRACAPDGGPVAELAYLDHLPLKPLARHLWKRAAQRLWWH